MAKKRLTPQDRIALGQLERAGGIRARTFGHQPHGHGNGNQAEAGKTGEERRGVVQILLRHVLHLRVRRLPQKSHRRLMRNNRWYEVRAWSRELAKSARSMMEISKLALTKKIRNVLLISNSADNAERLLLPFMANFEENQRIIQDYGQQKKPGSVGNRGVHLHVRMLLPRHRSRAVTARYA